MTINGKLYTSNIDTKKVLRVLDVGTGTGIWAMDYGMYQIVVQNVLQAKLTLAI
jgi:hypothetical protein